MPRPTLPAAIALLLISALMAPAGAAGAGQANRETVTGVLEAYYVDDFDGHDADDGPQFDLRTADGTIPVRFAGRGPTRLVGSRVTLTGTRSGGALRVATSSAGADLRVRAAAGHIDAAPDAHTFAVVLMNFTDITTQPWSKSTVASAIAGGSSSMKSFFEQESKGDMSVSASVYGWYTIPTTSAGCDWQAWEQLGWDEATSAGVDLSAFTNVMFISPYTSSCGFAGVGYVPGPYTYLNGTISTHVMAHEVGHNLGLAHANARSCTVDGTRVTIAANSACTTQGYADPFSVMGNVALRHNHGSQLGELGWLSASQKVVGSPGHTYTIAPWFGSGTVKLVRIPRGDGSFFDLDLRTPHGPFDTFATGSPAVNGATVRLGWGTASPTWSPVATELLDTTPATASLDDAPLLVGQTMTDPVSTISIATQSIGASGVTVRVTESTPPGMPGSLAATLYSTPSVGLGWSAASDNAAIASYRIRRDGDVVATVGSSVRDWVDHDVSIGTTYGYAVAAIDTSGNLGPEATTSMDVEAGGAPPPPDTKAPSKPANLHVRHRQQNGPHVTFAWAASSDDTGVVKYKIYRAGHARPIATTTSRHIRITTKAGAKYKVRAFDAAGNRSVASNKVLGRR